MLPFRAGTSEAGNAERYSLGNAPALAQLTGAPVRTALYVNLASAYAQQGQLGQAAQCARQALLAQPRCVPAALISAYVDLAAGNAAGALATLRQQR